MAAQVQVYGTCSIYICREGAPDTDFVFLGFTSDGVTFRSEVAIEEVYTDEWGGDAGIPAELIYHGERGYLEFNLNKFDNDTLGMIQSRLSGLSGILEKPNGFVPGPGIPIFGVVGAYRIRLIPPAPMPSGLPANKTITFNRCVPREAITINLGSKPTTAVCSFECYPVNGNMVYVQTDTTTSGA